jgi:hypothetical protein
MNPSQSMMPFMMPFPMPSPLGEGNQAPARMRLAVEVLRDLTVKTMDRVAVNDMSMQSIEGQKLTEEERILQISACKLLSDYFSGKTVLNKWEEVAVRSKDTRTAGLLMRCFSCNGKAGHACSFCNGTGAIKVFSAEAPEEQDDDNA